MLFVKSRALKLMFELAETPEIGALANNTMRAKLEIIFFIMFFPANC
ncbi:hypothetical protein CRENPOLYSF2_1970007 [Crenothrix polyspora]|uniref:Uncharacterized protein n=1 Tax=Crenothrix polyspora TaxID=360316 RepID=A0A1R4H3Y0_9GAMM|nr:hypothetical protein CRENPOLYSF2_1970007 [Crenothrix polyspora]